MDILKQIPKIDKFIMHKEFDSFGKQLLTSISKDRIEILRQKILNKELNSISEDRLIMEVKNMYKSIISPSLKPLINATGIILHTNMGRSLISSEILQRASKVICSYSNLEYNQNKGYRGERYTHVSSHLKYLLDVEDVIIVNNNASAVFLVLNTFAKEKEVIVSRGELVEIGGSFRIPEVMRQSGAILKEVGATNKTKIEDYSEAIGESTSMLMKVHQSNFTIEGFSEDVDFEEIQKLSQKHSLIDYYDLGSGYVVELPYNLSSAELPLDKILSKRPSLVSFSGDKLFGSVQAGIIVGKKKYIDKLKKNQLLRMLRVDKVTLSILEETLKAYIEERYDLIPTLNMLFCNLKVLQKRVEHVQKVVGIDKCEVVKCDTFMGGGTLPNRKFPSIALYVYGKANLLEKEFRNRDIIGRIESDKFLLDFRTILESQEENVISIIKELVV